VLGVDGASVIGGAEAVEDLLGDARADVVVQLDETDGLFEARGKVGAQDVELASLAVDDEECPTEADLLYGLGIARSGDVHSVSHPVVLGEPAAEPSVGGSSRSSDPRSMIARPSAGSATSSGICMPPNGPVCTPRPYLLTRASLTLRRGSVSYASCLSRSSST